MWGLGETFFLAGPAMDDVHYLLDSAKEESYLLLVDSRARDAAVHPTPSQYSVTFASPFRNVFGMDLLDATIARAEYIVETNTNVLEYALGQPASLDAWAAGAWAAGRRRTVTLAPGDYNLPQFVEHLNARLEAAAAAANEEPVRCAPATSPSEISNKIVLTCAVPFTLLGATSTLRHTLGFGDPVVTATADEYAAVPGWSVNRTGGASDAFLSRPTPDVGDADPRVATLGPVPAGDGQQVEPVYLARVLRQHFVSQASGPAARVVAYLSGRGAGWPLRVSVVAEESGLVLAQGQTSALTPSPDEAYVPVTVTLTGDGVLQAGQNYHVRFEALDPTRGDAANYVGAYYNQDNLPTDGTRYVTLDGAVVHAGQNLCCDVVLASDGHALRSPGVVNLSGPRYVNIRCPEIESHMYRDRVNEACHAGLGMVKLRGYGFREQRFDFVSFPPRRFHPLGKLSRLTFRLERPDGTLYDSHGVDHTLLLVLRYYSLPTAAAAAPTLNPSYVPDLRRYLVEQRWPEEARAEDRTAKRYGP